MNADECTFVASESEARVISALIPDVVRTMLAWTQVRDSSVAPFSITGPGSASVSRSCARSQRGQVMDGNIINKNNASSALLSSGSGLCSLKNYE